MAMPVGGQIGLTLAFRYAWLSPTLPARKYTRPAVTTAKAHLADRNGAGSHCADCAGVPARRSAGGRTRLARRRGLSTGMPAAPVLGRTIRNSRNVEPPLSGLPRFIGGCTGP